MQINTVFVFFTCKRVFIQLFANISDSVESTFSSEFSPIFLLTNRTNILKIKFTYYIILFFPQGSSSRLKFLHIYNNYVRHTYILLDIIFHLRRVPDFSMQILLHFL